MWGQKYFLKVFLENFLSYFLDFFLRKIPKKCFLSVSVATADPEPNSDHVELTLEETKGLRRMENQAGHLWSM